MKLGELVTEGKSKRVEMVEEFFGEEKVTQMAVLLSEFEIDVSFSYECKYCRLPNCMSRL